MDKILFLKNDEIKDLFFDFFRFPLSFPYFSLPFIGLFFYFCKFISDISDAESRGLLLISKCIFIFWPFLIELIFHLKAFRLIKTKHEFSALAIPMLFYVIAICYGTKKIIEWYRGLVDFE
jgi:hypothetical protein